MSNDACLVQVLSNMECNIQLRQMFIHFVPTCYFVLAWVLGRGWYGRDRTLR